MGQLQAGYLADEAQIIILPAVAVAVAVEFVRPVGPVVSVFIPGFEGNRYYPQFRAGDELLCRHTFSHCPLNTVVSGFICVAVMLLKTADNGNPRRIVLRIEEKLWAKVNAVLYGFFRGVIKEFSGVAIFVFGWSRDQKALWVNSVGNASGSMGGPRLAGFTFFG